MTLPYDDMLGDQVPQDLSDAVGKSHFFVITKALSLAGVMKPEIVEELERIDSLEEDQREAAFSEFMKGVEEQMAASPAQEDDAEEVYL